MVKCEQMPQMASVSVMSFCTSHGRKTPPPTIPWPPQLLAAAAVPVMRKLMAGSHLRTVLHAPVIEYIVYVVYCCTVY